MVCGSSGAMAMAPLASDSSLSVSGIHPAPPSIVFQTPPRAVAI